MRDRRSVSRRSATRRRSMARSVLLAPALLTTLLLTTLLSATGVSASELVDVELVVVDEVKSLTAEQSVLCHDGRPWTSEKLVEGECEVTNLCSPEEIALTTEEEPDLPALLRWTWTFPPACPMDAIDAVGVLVEHRVATDPSGDLTLGTIIVTDSGGMVDPGATDGSTVEITCGFVSLDFTVVAGSEVVATGTGSAFTRECPESVNPPKQPGLLEAYTSSSDAVGSLSRLYWVVFGRIPDRAGLGYWLAQTQTGLNLDDVAAIWTDLPEWEAAYGETTDEEFLTRIYQNVLGRAPDQDGFDYWFGRLADDLTRERLAVLFSDAPEFKERTETS